MQRKIAVIGLGYVGLPVAAAFAKKQPVIAYDINPKRIQELQDGFDFAHDVDSALLKNPNLIFTNEKAMLAQADFFIATVPTPSDATHKPDLQFLYSACQTMGSYLKVDDIVVFESTVYPGATQEECIPLLEHYSKLKAGIDFCVGYSPERINPGDKNNTFESIVKLVSAQNPETLEIVASVYEIVVNQVVRVPNIKVAEASKLLENTQRDLNIALMNELAIICHKMNIETQDVINAAKTKWNFMPFQPGLVGGHCIGVDPYYLTYKAKQLGYRPEVILAGRRINDNMGKYIAEQTVKKMIHEGSRVKNARVGVLGITFKENCRDIRNSKVIDVIHELETFGIHVLVHDPVADKADTLKEYDIELNDWEEIQDVDALVLCVPHHFYTECHAETFAEKLIHSRVFVDVKACLNAESMTNYDVHVWRL
jgi:UDP-N-acetyl-D-galactosamine dehydrogenase